MKIVEDKFTEIVNMKKFDNRSVTFRYLISILFSIVLFFILYAWVLKVSDEKIWIILIFFIVPMSQFFITPLFALLKLYRYYSPMVVTFGNNKRILDLHNGTSFDYLFEMQGIKPGFQWKKFMLINYLNALIKIIQEIENNKLPKSITIKGSSYFLTKRSSEKLGFTMAKASLSERINIYLNYFDLIWMYSFSEGQITLPQVNNIRTVKIKGYELILKKEKISNLLKKLQQ